MKFFNYIYFNLYRRFYGVQLDGEKVGPQELASMSFGMCAAGWTSLGLLVYNLLVTHSIIVDGLSKLIAICVFVIVYGIANWFYGSNDRGLIIYQHYTASEKEENKSKTTRWSLLFIYFPFCVFLAIVVGYAFFH